MLGDTLSSTLLAENSPDLQTTNPIAVVIIMVIEGVIMVMAAHRQDLSFIVCLVACPYQF